MAAVGTVDWLMAASIPRVKGSRAGCGNADNPGVVRLPEDLNH